jgi:hypothetical protein
VIAEQDAAAAAKTAADTTDRATPKPKQVAGDFYTFSI